MSSDGWGWLAWRLWGAVAFVCWRGVTTASSAAPRAGRTQGRDGSRRMFSHCSRHKRISLGCSFVENSRHMRGSFPINLKSDGPTRRCTGRAAGADRERLGFGPPTTCYLGKRCRPVRDIARKHTRVHSIGVLAPSPADMRLQQRASPSLPPTIRFLSPQHHLAKSSEAAKPPFAAAALHPQSSISTLDTHLRRTPPTSPPRQSGKKHRCTRVGWTHNAQPAAHVTTPRFKH